MTGFRPLNPRGAFVPSSALAAGPRAFAPMSTARTSPFTPGLVVRPEVPRVLSVAPPTPEPAQEPEPAHAPAPVAAPTAEADPALASQLAEAVAEAHAAAAEFTRRERVRAEEHAQLVADLELQKSKTKANNDRLGHLAGELVRLREAVVAEARANAGALLLLGARRLAGEGLRGEPGLLEALVRETVDGLGGGAATVRVNPEDVERLRAALGASIAVVGDTSIHAGCIAEGEHGAIEATVASAAGSLLTEVQAWKRTG